MNRFKKKRTNARPDKRLKIYKIKEELKKEDEKQTNPRRST